MNSPSVRVASSPSDVSARLAFFKGLQSITTRIHATKNIDEIIFELSPDLCSLFRAERISIYTLDDSRSAIVSKIKSGLHEFNAIRLPINAGSISGYVAMSRQLLNIADAYDDEELSRIHPDLHFRKDVDERSGFQSHQMLVTPIARYATAQVQTSMVMMKKSPKTAGTMVSVRPTAWWKRRQRSIVLATTRVSTIRPRV